MIEFKEEELAQFNGKNGNPAFVAYKGIVYDVSSSFHWKEGVHQVLHSAGLDLTEAFKQAPHNEDLLKKFPIIGTLQDSNVLKKSSFNNSELKHSIKP